MICYVKIFKIFFIIIDGLLKFWGYFIFEVMSVCFWLLIDYECGFMCIYFCIVFKYLYINLMCLMDYNVCLFSIFGGFMSLWGDWVVLSCYVVY